MIKVKRQTKKELAVLEAFRQGFRSLMTRLGGTETPGKFHDWIIATQLGPLALSVDSMHRTIFGRFDDPDRAKLRTACNPYSGKWNHHYFDGGNADSLADFERDLSRLL